MNFSQTMNNLNNDPLNGGESFFISNEDRRNLQDKNLLVRPGKILENPENPDKPEMLRTFRRGSQADRDQRERIHRMKYGSRSRSRSPGPILSSPELNVPRKPFEPSAHVRFQTPTSQNFHFITPNLISNPHTKFRAPLPPLPVQIHNQSGLPPPVISQAISRIIRPKPPIPIPITTSIPIMTMNSDPIPAATQKMMQEHFSRIRQKLFRDAAIRADNRALTPMIPPHIMDKPMFRNAPDLPQAHPKQL